MTVIEFVKKYNGKRVDFDNRFGAQCVDLFRQYCKEVWQVPQLPPVEGAKDFAESARSDKAKDYWFITNAQAFIGEVLVYGATPTNPYGHICIVLDFLDNDTYIVFEQDGYKQDGAKVALRNKENLLGKIVKLDK